jgi:hypothetical protein
MPLMEKVKTELQRILVRVGVHFFCLFCSSGRSRRVTRPLPAISFASCSFFWKRQKRQLQEAEEKN